MDLITKAQKMTISEISDYCAKNSVDLQTEIKMLRARCSDTLSLANRISSSFRESIRLLEEEISIISK
jgi:translation initiation factor IF-1